MLKQPLNISIKALDAVPSGGFRHLVIIFFADTNITFFLKLNDLSTSLIACGKNVKGELGITKCKKKSARVDDDVG